MLEQTGHWSFYKPAEAFAIIEACQDQLFAFDYSFSEEPITGIVHQKPVLEDYLQAGKHHVK